MGQELCRVHSKGEILCSNTFESELPLPVILTVNPLGEYAISSKELKLCSLRNKSTYFPPGALPINVKKHFATARLSPNLTEIYRH